MLIPGCGGAAATGGSGSLGRHIIAFPGDRSCGECSFILALVYKIKGFVYSLDKPENSVTNINVVHMLA